jgi:Tol biopolymer transport system component
MERIRTQDSAIVRRLLDGDRARGSSAGHTSRTRPQRWRWGASSLLLLLFVLPVLAAGVVKIERVSPPPLDVDVTLPSSLPAISADGRFVAFRSADETGESRGAGDIYVRDRQTGATELVSVSMDGAPSGASSSWYDGNPPSISGDGRFVAFWSMADNLAPGHEESGWSIYVRDRQVGKTEWVGNGTSPAISADGRFVAFVTPSYDGSIFVWDRQSGKTEWVGDGSVASLSADGRFVAFVGEGTYLRDRQTGKTERLGGGGGYLWAPSISSDGRFVAFEWEGIQVWDRQTGKAERVGDGGQPAISSDGRFVAFTGNGTYLRDRQTGKTERLGDGGGPSISGDGHYVAFITGRGVVLRDRVAATTEVIGRSVNVGQTPLHSYSPAISADGQWVAFKTEGQVFERNRTTGAVGLVSVAPNGEPGNGFSYTFSISADGRFVAFDSTADNLVPGGTPSRWGDVFVRDRQTGTTECVSVGINGAPASYPEHGSSGSPSISADGRFIAFQSDATNLVPGPLNAWRNVFVRDRQTEKTEYIADGGSPAISADGRFVAFYSYASNLVPGKGYGIYVRDRQTGKTEFIADGGSPTISGDGRFVAFASGDGTLTPGDTNGCTDVFVAERG